MKKKTLFIELRGEKKSKKKKESLEDYKQKDLLFLVILFYTVAQFNI